MKIKQIACWAFLGSSLSGIFLTSSVTAIRDYPTVQEVEEALESNKKLPNKKAQCEGLYKINSRVIHMEKQSLIYNPHPKKADEYTRLVHKIWMEYHVLGCPKILGKSLAV